MPQVLGTVRSKTPGPCLVCRGDGGLVNREKQKSAED